MADDGAHIGVGAELAEFGGCPVGLGNDGLQLAPEPDRKKAGQEDRTEGLAWACCGMRGWRETMEDASLMMPCGYVGGNWRDAALFGVFDGHGGEQVARFAVRKLPEVFADLPADDLEGAFTQAYNRIDRLLRRPMAATELRELTIPGNDIKDSADYVGTTAVCCMLRGSELVVANAGDSRAVLCRNGKAVALSEDHKPMLPEEKARIEAAGGEIEEESTSAGSRTEYRINGGLNLSRALGDLSYKNPNLQPHQQMISGVPDVKTLQWKVGVEEFVLLACDGVWDCMSSQQAVDFVRRRLPPQGTKRGLTPVLEALLDACCATTPTQRGGLGCDNLTAVLVRFEDPATAALAAEAEAKDEVTETAVTQAQQRQMEAALTETIQRLADRKYMKKETEEERARRLKEERKELEEELAREEEEQRKAELRKKRREEREMLEAKSKKRLRCCAAMDDGEDDDEDDVF
eukprot:TRINITY_DN30317_c0_g1_i1.p1 TRINITY_DN30317_c0_g1~~TRINITY_DN30317_c0_g1_i1.p1  ORF type:complete len:463 (-),score=118.16 TRINITY_DN30317_c0_g1_i1:124-1512(-)